MATSYRNRVADFLRWLANKVAGATPRTTDQSAPAQQTLPAAAAAPPPAGTDGQSSAPPPAKEEARQHHPSAFSALHGIMACGVLALVWHGCTHGRFGTSLLWALACLACGAAIGFLFGIPKVLQASGVDVGRNQDGDGSDTRRDPQQGVNPDTRTTGGRRKTDYGLEMNTSLTQISDWLCKIIVGVGLIQLTLIPGWLDNAAARIAADLGSPADHSFALALILYFSILGFLYGYLLTRLVIQEEIVQADKRALSVRETVVLEVSQAKETVVREVVQVKDTVAQVQGLMTDFRKEVVLANAISEGITAREYGSPADVARAIERLHEARGFFPDNRRSGIVLAGLYAKKQNQFAKGIEILDDLLAKMKERNTRTDRDESDIRYNCACYRCLLAKDSPAGPRKEELLASLYSDLATAFRLHPANKADAWEDEDFDSIKTDPKFMALAGPDPRTAQPTR
jgi:hypothetical protein